MAKLKLYKPLNPFIISQNFGEDKVCISQIDNKTIISRINLTCPNNYESLYKKYNLLGHNGKDCMARDWQPIYSSTDGFVHEIETEKERGLGVGIITNEKFEVDESPQNKSGSYFIKVRYWHLAAYAVSLNQQIRTGQLIGWANNTGFSTNTHLHWETKLVDKKLNGEWFNVFQDNGFYGAFDSTPYIQNLTAFETNELITRIRLQLIDLMNKLQNLLSPK